MKKFLILILSLLCITQSAHGFLFFKKKTPPGPPEHGYSGTLPNIHEHFKVETKSLPQDKMQIGPPKKEDLLESPLGDSIFLDVIIKKDPTSKYVNDLQPIIVILQDFRKSIAKGEDIQRFNAHVNVFDLYARSLQSNYGERKEAQSPSYQALLGLNYRSKLLGNLKFDANYYSRYIPVPDEAYTPQSIARQDKIMIDEIDKVIDILKQAK